MANFIGQPLAISRMLGFADCDSPDNLPAGIGALVRNCDFSLTSVMTRAGINLTAGGIQVGIQGLNRSPISGLIGLLYTPENAGEQFYQLPLLFDRAGTLQVEAEIGSGATQPITSALFTPPANAHMIATQAYNEGFLAFSDLIYPLSNPSSPSPGMAVLDLETFKYGDPTKALDPYGMKPYGWNWLPATSVLVGEVATPTTKNQNGHTYQCITGGVTAAALANEPAWPTTSGAQVNDGTAVWKECTPQFSAVYPCYPPPPSWTTQPGGGSWPASPDGNLQWIYFAYTYVTVAGETDIGKALVGLQTPAIGTESYIHQLPAPPSAPAGFSGNVPSGWNLYVAFAPEGTTGIPAPTGFQKWNAAPLAFATPYTVSQQLNNGAAPTTNTAAVVGAGNCDAFELLDDVSYTPGSGISGSLYEAGIRYAAVMFVNRNYTVSGFTRAAAVPVQIFSNGSTIIGQNIPTGPANIIARVVALTNLQFDSDISSLASYNIQVGGGSSGSQTQIAGTTNRGQNGTPCQWRTVESDGSLNEQWNFVNGEWKAVDPASLALIATQQLGFSLGSGAAITGFLFDLNWLNQPGGSPAYLTSAQISYQGNLIGNAKLLNLPSTGSIGDAIVGGPGDTWGASLTPEMLSDPTFGVQFQIQPGTQNPAYNPTNLYIIKCSHTAYFSGTSESFSIPKARGTSAGPYFAIGNYVPGPDYFVFPQSTPSDGVQESATILGDNLATTAHFSYTEPYLIASNDMTDRLRVIWPYPAVDVYYSPTLDRLVATGVPGFNGHWISLASDPESYYIDSGFVPTQNADGERAICAREFRGQLFSLRERSGHVMQIAAIDNDGNPAWNVRQRWSKVGPCGPRAVDVCGRFMIFVHRSGVFKYDGNPNAEGGAPEPMKVSKEIRYWWQTINWQAAETVWCNIDEEDHCVRIGLPTGSSTVPNVQLKLYYEEGWNTPIHFSAFLQKEISMESARRYSIDDVAAFIGLRLERILPSLPPFDQGDEGIAELGSVIGVTQFAYASSAPDGAVLAITPGIWHDGEGSANGPTGIDWEYETTSQGAMLMQSKFEGFALNARGEGKLYWAALQGRTSLLDWSPEGAPKASTDKFVAGRPIDLAIDQHVGDNRLVQTKFGERWRLHFSNAKIVDAWAELKSATLFAIPISTTRPQSQDK